MRQSVSQTGTYNKATPVQNTTAKKPVLGEPEAPCVPSRLGLLEKDRGLPSVLMNIYVFMYILLGEGGGVCNIYSNLCRGARYAPLL